MNTDELLKTVKTNSLLKDLLGFDKMFTPMIVRVLYFIGIVVVILSGLAAMFQSFLAGLFTILLGPIFVRIYCELAIVVFGIHNNLSVIRQLKEEATSTPVTTPKTRTRAKTKPAEEPVVDDQQPSQ